MIKAHHLLALCASVWYQSARAESGVVAPVVVESIEVTRRRVPMHAFVEYVTPTGRLLVHQGQVSQLKDRNCGVVRADGAFRRIDAPSRETRYSCRRGKLDGTLSLLEGGKVVKIETYRSGVLARADARPTHGDPSVTTLLKPELGALSPTVVEEFRGKERRFRTLTDPASGRTTRIAYAPGGAKVSEMELQGGMPNGDAQFWHPNGQLYGKGPFKDGWMTGDWQLFHANGKLRAKGRFERGKSGAHFRKGPWEFYTPSGALSSRIEMPGDQSMPRGIKGDWYNDSFSRSGYPEVAMEMRDDLAHGETTNWHQNGQRRAFGRYDKWQPVGAWSWWKKDGTAASSDKESLE